MQGRQTLAAVLLLAANAAARSDNSLSNMLGLGNMDLYLNLEQKQNDEPLPVANQIVPASNALESNELDDNKITFTRHNYRDYESESSSEEDRLGDCPECFTDMRHDGVPIRHEMGDPGHRHHHAYEKMARYDQAFNKHSENYDNYKGDADYNGKHKRYGESIMSEKDIRSEYGHGGKSSLGGRGGQPRHFSFDDFNRSPSRRHYETKGHSFKYETGDFDGDDEDEEDGFEVIPRKTEKKKKSKKSRKSRQEEDAIADIPDNKDEEEEGAYEEPTIDEPKKEKETVDTKEADA